MRPRISHVEIYVSQYKESIMFYDKVLKPMGFDRVNCCKTFTAYSDGFSKIIICPVEEKYKDIPYHRKGIGLNHLAIYADSKEEVDQFHEEVLLKNDIKSLYKEGAFGDDDYYAVFFEGPDRLKLEFVYAPRYCDLDAWPCNIEDDFDPYLN